MATALELAKCTFARHLALEVLDRTLDAFVSYLHLERPALHCFTGISHGPRDMADGEQERKRNPPFSTP